MDFSRLSPGERIAAAAGAILLIDLFLPWYGAEGAEGSATAWESFAFIDILLFLIALTAILLPLARAGGGLPDDLPWPAGTIVAAVGALATLLVLYRLLSTPDFNADAIGIDLDINRKIGAFLGLIAGAGIAYGGYTAMNEPAPPPRPTSTTP